MIVTFQNEGAFVASFSVQWNGGESGRTPVVRFGETTAIDMANFPPPGGPGVSCWARAHIQGGPNHDSADNFNPDGGNVEYVIKGTILSPSFSMR